MDRSSELARSLIAAAHERRALLVAKLERLVDTQQEVARLIELIGRELSALDELLAHEGRALAVAGHEQRVLQEVESLRRAEPGAENESAEAADRLFHYLPRSSWIAPGPGTGKTERLLFTWLRPEQGRPSIADAARLALEALGRPAHLSEIAGLMAVETGRRPPSGSLMAALSRDDRFTRTDVRGYWALADWPDERRCVPEEVLRRVRLQDELVQERRRQQDLRLTLEQNRQALNQANVGEISLTSSDPEDLKAQLERLQDLLRTSEARAAHLQAELDNVERAVVSGSQNPKPGGTADRKTRRKDG